MRMFVNVIVILTGITVANVYAEKPILVADYRIDTSLYMPEMNAEFRFAPGPVLRYNQTQSSWSQDMFLWALRKKNSNEVDIYSYNGKSGTSVFPQIPPRDENGMLTSTMFLSQYYVDADPQWEGLLCFVDSNRFLLLDNDGTELLSDTGDVGYGFDGRSTYLVMMYRQRIKGLKTWRLRSDVAAGGAIPSMGKQSASVRGSMQVFGLSNGSFRVTLSQQSGTGTQFQLYDMLGRCLLTKTVKDMASPVSFTIPEGKISRSPFVVEAKNAQSTHRKMVLPVR